MNTTDPNTPTLNGEHADFRLDPDNLERRDHVNAYTSRRDLEDDIRGALDPEHWDSDATYDTTVEAVADHFGHWIDYTRGVWAGTDVAASIAAVDHDDFWDVVAEAIADRLELYAGRACATRPTCEECTD